MQRSLLATYKLYMRGTISVLKRTAAGLDFSLQTKKVLFFCIISSLV